jgi:predicted RNase H-like HicB family nuclease
MDYPILIYPNPEGGYVAEIPQLKGCIAQGETEVECLRELDHVMNLWIETAKANNIPLPSSDNFLERLRHAVNA